MKAKIAFFRRLVIFVSITLYYHITLAADYWTSTANMLHNRQDHTATLLQNGKVLITGWNDFAAELYDPETGSFTETGSTIQFHMYGSTAILLNNGQVLIVGGYNAQRFAELYDPDTGTFVLTDSLTAPHSFHTATLLQDGRVLIAGGQDQKNGPTTHAVCEIYDPLTGTFSLTDSLNKDRSAHTATLLPDGQILITGGIQTTTPGSGIYLDSCELYDPVNGTFSLIQNINQPRMEHCATLLNNGKVLISGGSYYQRYGELYDYTTKTWALTGNMNILRRSNHSATLLDNGLVLLAGGFMDSSLKTAEVYNPITNAFYSVDSMDTARSQHTATKLTDGNVLVTGGYSTSESTSSSELYIVDTSIIVSTKDSNNHPGSIETFELFQNYPNPFNSGTTITYRLPGEEDVFLDIYDISGRKTLALNRSKQSAGIHSLHWDGKNTSGLPVASGIYNYVLTVGNQKISKQMQYIK